MAIIPGGMLNKFKAEFIWLETPEEAAGIDMALTLLSELEGTDVAEGVALAIEYAPLPPFDSGRPELARPEVLVAARRRLEELGAARNAAAKRAAARLELPPGA